MTGYSRAYFQFLIGLRNKSIKISGRFLDTTFYNNAANRGVVPSTFLIPFFIKFKLLLQRIQRLILSCALKRRRSGRQFYTSFYKRVFLLLTKFNYTFKSYALIDTLKISVFAKRLSAIILNLFARKQICKNLNSTTLSQILNLLNIFSGNKLGVGGAVLINKCLVSFFR